MPTFEKVRTRKQGDRATASHVTADTRSPGGDRRGTWALSRQQPRVGGPVLVHPNGGAGTKALARTQDSDREVLGGRWVGNNPP